MGLSCSMNLFLNYLSELAFGVVSEMKVVILTPQNPELVTFLLQLKQSSLQSYCTFWFPTCEHCLQADLEAFFCVCLRFPNVWQPVGSCQMSRDADLAC